MKTLRKKHSRTAVLAYIIGYKRLHDGNSPTIREIADACHINSTSNTAYIIGQLVKDGVIENSAGQPRSIMVVGGKWDLELETK